MAGDGVLGGDLPSRCNEAATVAERQCHGNGGAVDYWRVSIRAGGCPRKGHYPPRLKARQCDAGTGPALTDGAASQTARLWRCEIT